MKRTDVVILSSSLKESLTIKELLNAIGFLFEDGWVRDLSL